MLYIVKKAGKQILKNDWQALAIRYANGVIRYMFGLSHVTECKIREIFSSVGPVTNCHRSSTGDSSQL